MRITRLARIMQNLEKMAKQKWDELEDTDDASESMYFMPGQYLCPYCSEVHSNRQSTLPLEGPNISGTLKKTSSLVKRFPGMMLRCPLAILLIDQQAKNGAPLLARKLSSLCVVLLSVISLLNH